MKIYHFSLIGSICGLILLFGCANKPNIMKTERDCVKGKIQKVGSVYLCLEVGGDVKEKIE